MTEHYDVVVIGAGQAGLSIGYYLSKFDIEFVILKLDISNTGPFL
jgi:cation diffusion facilitator CzcD-associated flavoprotein CzcO